MSELDPVVVIGSNDKPVKAVVCARYAVEWVAEAMRPLRVNVLEVEQHWTMTVIHREEELR